MPPAPPSHPPGCQPPPRPARPLPGVEVAELKKVTAQALSAMARLLPQIDPRHTGPSAERLQQVVDFPCCCCLLAWHGEVIVGTLTLVVFPLPSQVRAWFENVVVDASFRGRGIGEALCREGLRRAARAGAPSVELTSRSARRAAGRLYERVGFVRRDTNAYRFDWKARPLDA